MSPNHRHERTSPKLASQMLPTDAFFWYAEAATPALRPLVAGLFLLDRDPDRAGLRNAIENLVCGLPRFRQRVVEPRLPFDLPGWEDDRAFDLDYHLREISLPKPATTRQFLGYVSEVFSAPLDHMRPLWEGHLISGLEDGRAALLLKVHHSVVDGVGSVAMFDIMTQARRNEPIPRRRRPRRPPDDSRTTSDVSRLVRGGLGLASAALGGAVGLVRDPRAAGEQWIGSLRNVRRVLADLTAPRNTHPFVRPGSGVGRRLDGVLLSLPRMRRLKNKLGVTLNDLILTSVAGAMGRYHERYHLHLDEISCMVPMNLRQAHQRRQLGNRVGAFYVSLPVGLKDPMARLERIREQTSSAKSDRQGATYQKIMQAASLFPSAAFRFATRSLEGRIHLICTNVPGPPAHRYLAGAKICGVYPFAPIMLGTPLSIALLSYGSSYGVGIDADSTAIPDPERIGVFLLEEIDRIEQHASRMRRGRGAASNIVTRRPP